MKWSCDKGRFGCKVVVLRVGRPPSMAQSVSECESCCRNHSVPHPGTCGRAPVTGLYFPGVLLAVHFPSLHCRVTNQLSSQPSAAFSLLFPSQPREVMDFPLLFFQRGEITKWCLVHYQPAGFQPIQEEWVTHGGNSMGWHSAWVQQPESKIWEIIYTFTAGKN